MNRLATIIALSAASCCGQGKADELPPLRAGIPMSSFARNSASDARTAVEVFLKRVFAEANTPFQGKIYETDEELLSAIEAGEVDLVAMHSELYVANEKLPIRPILISQSGSKPLETLVLVAKQGVPLGALRDRSLIIDQSARGYTPLRWISDNLLRSGRSAIAEKYFEKIEMVHSASKALIPVYFGKQDAAILSETDYRLLSEHNPEIAKRLHVVAGSEPLARTILCLRGDRTDYRPYDIANLSATLTGSEDGKQFLKSIGAEQLVPFKEEYLESSRQLHRRSKVAKATGAAMGGDR